MKDFLLKLRAAAVVLSLAFGAMLPPEGVLAQVVTSLPVQINPNSIVDLGNGPNEFRILLGNAWMFTSQGTGTGGTSGSSTSLTLNAVPATPPCIGCFITGTGLTTQTVTAFNGVTNVTLSAAATVATPTTLSWGAACPAFSGGLPAPNIQLQAGSHQTDLPMYTEARICGYAANGPGVSLLPFPIEAH